MFDAGALNKIDVTTDDALIDAFEARSLANVSGVPAEFMLRVPMSSAIRLLSQARMLRSDCCHTEDISACTKYTATAYRPNTAQYLGCVHSLRIHQLNRS